MPVSSSVPQGSVHASVLFIIYINNIVIGLSNYICKFAAAAAAVVLNGFMNADTSELFITGGISNEKSQNLSVKKLIPVASNFPFRM